MSGTWGSSPAGLPSACLHAWSFTDSSERPTQSLFYLFLFPLGSKNIDDFEHIEAVHHQAYAPADRAPENQGVLESHEEAKGRHEDQIHKHVAVEFLHAFDVLNRVFLIGGDWRGIRHGIVSRFEQ